MIEKNVPGGNILKYAKCAETVPKTTTNPKTNFLFELSAIVSMLLDTTIITLRHVETNVITFSEKIPTFPKNCPKIHQFFADFFGKSHDICLYMS